MYIDWFPFVGAMISFTGILIIVGVAISSCFYKKGTTKWIFSIGKKEIKGLITSSLAITGLIFLNLLLCKNWAPEFYKPGDTFYYTPSFIDVKDPFIDAKKKVPTRSFTVKEVKDGYVLYEEIFYDEWWAFGDDRFFDLRSEPIDRFHYHIENMSRIPYGPVPSKEEMQKKVDLRNKAIDEYLRLFEKGKK